MGITSGGWKLVGEAGNEWVQLMLDWSEWVGRNDMWWKYILGRSDWEKDDNWL